MHYQRHRQFGTTSKRTFPDRDERFFSKVQKSDGCWTWTGAINDRGYGVFNKGRRTQLAHRFAYERVHGEGTAKGLFVCHRCDNPSCVRLDHLFLGTPLDNVRDMIAKNRRADIPVHRGEDHHSAKLTDGAVLQLRAARAQGVKWTDLARDFGIELSTARRAVLGRTWTHLQGANE